MAICSANMRSCDEKKRCQFGPNKGLAYKAKDPCCGAGTFSPDLCDCVSGYGVYEVEVELLTTELATNPSVTFMWTYVEIRAPYFESSGQVVNEALGQSLFARDIPGAVGTFCDKCALGEYVTEKTFCLEDIQPPYACLPHPDTGLPDCKRVTFASNGMPSGGNPAYTIWNIPKGTYYRRLCDPVCEPKEEGGTIPNYELPLSPAYSDRSFAVDIVRLQYYPETAVFQDDQQQSIVKSNSIQYIASPNTQEASCRGIRGGYYNVDYKFIGEGTITDNYGSDSRWNNRWIVRLSEKLTPLVDQ